ncbi:general transcription repressor [Batrachochytrium dendrobatidis]
MSSVNAYRGGPPPGNSHSSGAPHAIQQHPSMHQQHHPQHVMHSGHPSQQPGSVPQGAVQQQLPQQMQSHATQQHPGHPHHVHAQLQAAQAPQNSPKPPQQQSQQPSLPIAQNRIVEALESARKEVDQVFKEITVMKYHKEEAEYKLSAQINEMTAFQQTLYDLERRHQTMKLHNEEEVARLRRELEVRGISIPLPTQMAAPSGSAASGGSNIGQSGSGGPHSLQDSRNPVGHRPPSTSQIHQQQQQHMLQHPHKQLQHSHPQQMTKAGFPEGVPPPVLSQPRQTNGVFGALMGGPPQGHSNNPSAIIGGASGQPPHNGYPHPGSAGPGGPQQSLGPVPGSNDHASAGHANGMDPHGPKRQRPDDPNLQGPPPQRQKQQQLSSGGAPPPQPSQGPQQLPPHNVKMGQTAATMPTSHHIQQQSPSSAVSTSSQHPIGAQSRLATTTQSAMKQFGPTQGTGDSGLMHPQQQHMKQPEQQPPSNSVSHQQPQAPSTQSQQQPAAASQQQQSAPVMEDPPTTGYIDFEARKSSEEGKTSGDDFACFINPIHATALKMPLHVEPLKMFNLHSVVCCVKFSPDGRYLGIGCSKSAEIYDVQTFQRVCMLTDDTTRKDYYIRSVVFSPDGRFVASGAEDHLVRVCDIEQQSIKLRLPGHHLDIYSIDWSNDGKFIASASGDRTVKIWDPITGACKMTLSCDDDQPQSSASGDAPKDSGLTSVAIRPSDSRCVAAGAIDDTIRLWDALTGQLLERFVGHQNSVYAVAFSPTGLSLVSGSLDRNLRVWDISAETEQFLKSGVIPTPAEIAKRHSVVNSKPRHLFRGHKDFILSVAFPGKGSSLGSVDRQGRPLPAELTPGLNEIDWIVSSSKDRHVTLWDASLDGTNPFSAPVALVSGHRNSVISVAVSSVGGLLATGSGDMRTRLWRVSCDTSASDVPPSAEAYAKAAGISKPESAVKTEGNPEYATHTGSSNRQTKPSVSPRSKPTITTASDNTPLATTHHASNTGNPASANAPGSASSIAHSPSTGIVGSTTRRQSSTALTSPHTANGGASTKPYTHSNQPSKKSPIKLFPGDGTAEDDETGDLPELGSINDTVVGETGAGGTKEVTASGHNGSANGEDGKA